MEICLSRHLQDPHDVITPIIMPEDEALRAAGNIFPRNYALPGAPPNTPDINQMRFWNHIPAQEIKERLQPGVWKICSKITSERHPYEKAVSLAWLRFSLQERQEDNAPSSFQEMLEYTVNEGGYENWPLYSIDGECVADTVIRYEYLLEDTNRLLQSLGLPSVSALPLTKAQFRKDRSPAADVLSFRQKKRIQAVCAREFEYHGYSY